MLINAGAGCAKTTTCSLYVKQQIENGCPEEAICFITFTRFAADEIKTKLKKVMGRKPNVWTGTFHKTMFKFMTIAGIIQPESVNLFSKTMDLKVNFFLDQIEKRNPSLMAILQRFHIVITDEFQDGRSWRSCTEYLQIPWNIK